MTPLHLCCDIVAENSSRIALLLLQRDDINVHAVNEAGQTPLDVAKAGRKVWVFENLDGTWTMSGVSGPMGMTNFGLLFLLEEDELIKKGLRLIFSDGLFFGFWRTYWSFSTKNGF